MSLKPPDFRSSETEYSFTQRVGWLEVSVTRDPIEAVLRSKSVDAVVSSDDSVLSMGGGVSAAIAALTGPGLREEVLPLLPLPVGAVAITSGGRLPVRYVLHAVTVDWQKGIRPSERTIAQVVREILNRCEILHV